MTFNELEKICSLLWGRSWQSELARTLNIDRRTVNGWKRQAVPKWVGGRMVGIVDSRIFDVMKSKELITFIH